MAVSAGIGIVGLGLGYIQDKKAEKAQKRADRKAARIEAIKANRERVQAQRQNRVNAAQIFAQATNGGTGTSSGVAGSIGSLETQAAGNIAFANNIDQLNAERLQQIQKANKAEATGNTIQGVTQLGIKAKQGGLF